MAKGNGKTRTGTIAALDIGSSKVCCVVARAEPGGSPRVIGVGHVVAKGVRSGAVTGMDDAEASVLAAVNSAEKMAGETIAKVIVNCTAGAPVSETINVDVAIAAARHGKHLVTVKPCAMTVADAERLRDAVTAAGVLAVPFEAHTRFQPHGRTLARMIRDGAIGTPLSATLVGRFTVDGARLDWPGQPNPNAWWMDPKRAPGGGWIDHAIYLVDWLEWAFADRIVRVTGVARTLVHHDLHPEKEDFGVALLEFSRGAVATVEVTWSSPRGHYFMGWQIVGTEGDLDWDGLRERILGLKVTLWTLIVPPTVWAGHFLFCYLWVSVSCAKRADASARRRLFARRAASCSRPWRSSSRGGLPRKPPAGLASRSSSRVPES